MKTLQKYFTIYEMTMIVAFAIAVIAWAVGAVAKGGVGLILGAAVIAGAFRYARLAVLSWKEYKEDNE